MTSKNSERNGINSDVKAVDVGSDRNTEKELDTLLNMNRGHRVEPPALKVVEPPSISKGNTKLLMYINCHLHVCVILAVVFCCYIGIDLDLSKPKGMPFDLQLHTYSFTTKYINMAKA